MAISANAVFEFRADATSGNANGAFFVTGASGSDFSQQAAAQYNLTGATSAGAGAIILHASAAADMVGNGARVSGTNFTSGWYEIISVVVGVSITVDRNCTTGVGSAGVVNIGGAASMSGTGSFTTDALLETMVAGNIVYFKSGSYTEGTSVSLATGIGTTTARIKIIGYTSTRGDTCNGTDRPLISLGTRAFGTGAYTDVSNLSFTGTTASNMVVGGVGSKITNCKIYHNGTTADINALSGFQIYESVEAVNLRGKAASLNGGVAINCYFHDSKINLACVGAAGVRVIHCILARGVTSAVDAPASSGVMTLVNCTLYGSAAKIGTGLSVATGILHAHLFNCIIKGFVTGASHADAGSVANFLNYNTFHNNTADVSNFTKGPGDIALDPSFTSVSEVTGSTATTSGSVLTQSGADFSSVVDGASYCHLISGTGVTIGKYGITSHTTDTLTLDIAPGTSATADKVFSVGIGNNFAVGANMQAGAIPGIFPASLTTGYNDIGAVQRQIDLPAISNVKLGTVYDNGLKTGTYSPQRGFAG